MGMFGDLSKAAREEFAAQLHARFDAWQNLITGLGTLRDKRLGGKFQPDVFLDPQSLENLFNGDDMAAKAAEMVVVDALKKGFDLTSGDADNASDAKEEADEVKQLMDELGAEDAVAEAATWGRLYGAGGILLGARDGKKPTEELIDDDVVSLDFLTTLEIRDMFVEAYYADPMKSSYGRPMIYRIQPVTGTSSMVSSMTQYVHASRIIMFEGVRTSRRTKVARQGFSLSVLQRIYEILRDANANWSSTSHLMTDANLAVMKVKGFLQMIAGKDTTDMQTRLEMVDMAKSVARAYVCDADTEDYERKPTSFAGYPEILDRTWQRLASAMPESTPVTKLIGMAPAGMNATGESDERVWGNSVEGFQQKRLKRPIERIARLAARTLGVSEPDSICVSFPPYRQLTPQEEADRRQKVATTDQIYITAGVWLPEEVATARVKGGQYSADPPIVDLELRERVLNKQLAAYEANAGKTVEQGGSNPDGTQGGQANATTSGGGDEPASDDPARTDDFTQGEARDKDGKWTGGGASGKSPKAGSDRARDIARQSTPAMDEPHYHGTDAKNVPSILAHGIKPTDKSLGIKTAWASTSVNLAASYAAGRATNNGSDKYAIVVLKSAQKAGLQNFRGDKSAAYSTETIKPEHIDHVDIYNVKDGKLVNTIHPSAPTPAFNARDIVASAVKNGGFTVDLAGKAAPSEGFSVSAYPEHERKIAGNMTPAALKSYRDDKADFVKADPARKIGGWYNVKDDTWYLDVSHVVKNRDEAIKVAKEHKQYAIYNLGEGHEERIEGARQ